MNEKLAPNHFPRIVALANGEAARVTRCDSTDIAFDRGTGTTLANFVAEYPAQAVLPIAGFDPETAEEWPSDAALAAAFDTPMPAPTPVVVLTPLQILGRLTPEEEAALATATDLAVQIVRNRLIAASEVRSDDLRTAEGRAILVAKEIVSDERATEIFA